MVIVQLIFILAYVVSGNVEICGLFPAINFLFAVEPDLGDGLNSLLYESTLELFLEQVKMRRQHLSHLSGHLFIFMKANSEIHRYLYLFFFE